MQKSNSTISGGGENGSTGSFGNSASAGAASTTKPVIKIKHVGL